MNTGDGLPACQVLPGTLTDTSLGLRGPSALPSGKLISSHAAAMKLYIEAAYI